MKHILKIIGISALFMYTSYTKGQNMTNSIPLINIGDNTKKMEIINLSQFAYEIQYIPFETKEDMYFTPYTDFIISGDLTLVGNYSEGCLLYNTKGQFISRIGSMGKGPGEYIENHLVESDINKHIYIKSLYDLVEYKADGSFVEKYKKLLSINDRYYMYSGFMINDSLILGHLLNTTGNVEYKALIVNKNGNIKRYYKNYIQYKGEAAVVSGFEGKNTHYNKYNGTVFYKEVYNDTLFYLDNKYGLIPKYAFTFGKYKQPLSDRAKFPEQLRYKSIYLSFVYQTKDYLFLNCHFNQNIPAKRLTPKDNGFGGLEWYNTNNVLGIYNKSTQELVFCKPTSTDNPLFTSGLYNDIDAGPRFFPAKQINDSTMVMWIEAKQLKDHVASNDFKNNISKYPEKKKELEMLTNSLSEFDNPVLMFVTFRK